jgi:hypothetical protein
MCVMSAKLDTKFVHIFSHECMCSELCVELVNAQQFVIRVNDLCMGAWEDLGSLRRLTCS